MPAMDHHVAAVAEGKRVDVGPERFAVILGVVVDEAARGACDASLRAGQSTRRALGADPGSGPVPLGRAEPVVAVHPPSLHAPVEEGQPCRAVSAGYAGRSPSGDHAVQSTRPGGARHGTPSIETLAGGPSRTGCSGSIGLSTGPGVRAGGDPPIGRQTSPWTTAPPCPWEARPSIERTPWSCVGHATHRRGLSVSARQIDGERDALHPSSE